MKRSIADVLRRSILSTLANWPVIVARMVETLVLFGLFVLGIVGIIVPLVVAAGIEFAGHDPKEVLAAILANHVDLFVYLFAYLLVVGLVMVAVHAFVTAGATRIYVDAERAAPDDAEPRREQFAAFTLERWGAGARAAWVRMFWIYNGVGTMYGLLLLLPVLLVGALTLAAVRQQDPAAIVAASCGGLALLLVLAIPLGIVMAVWAQKAVVVCVARDLTAAEALSGGWRETRADFLRHLVVYFLITAIAAGVSTILSSALAPFTFVLRGQQAWPLLGPLQLVSFALQMAISNGVGVWMIAAFAAMTETN